ncbi:glycosyl hydrolase family 95 catalytic domain-containing protein [Streptomyces jumonjinensis]|uniref:glycosyl hydrolase family 95 catalytic domain-containing protein n=1 Tax=Streptomyces jumonjinensis TaxID=1945 RepID=UPI003798A231
MAIGAAASTTGSMATGAPAGASPAGEQRPGVRGMSTDHEWERFLADQDLIWKRLPRAWYEGPFLGNGLLGSILYAEPGEDALRFTVHHSQVQDHRPEFGNEWGVARLPVGNLVLTPVGAVTGVDLRLDLWNAEIVGTVTTDRGTLRLRAFVHNDRTLLSATVRASRGEEDFRWEFRPSPAVSPRIVRENPPKGFAPNPPPVARQEEDGTGVVTQELYAGGQTASAHRERRRGRERTILLAVAHSYPARDAEERALAAVRDAAARPLTALRRTHREWWHSFYRKSFISVPDQLIQSFYWIQLYKLACAARAHAPVMATTGPWLEPTPWPSVWWNLNAQLEYWPVYGSNHLELDAIPRTLRENTDILIGALKPPYRHDSAGLRRSTDAQCDDTGTVGVPGVGDPEVGDLPWALHNVWLSYRHSLDLTILEEVLYPLLRRSTNYYLHFLFPGSDGKLHLPRTFSPEYGSAPDCTYDLALLRWSCETLLETVRLLKRSDPLESAWREVLAKLTGYAVDEKGFMVGAGVPFAKSHRHYSHLLAVYPLHLVNWDQVENRDLIARSLQHWIGFEGALRGYSFTGAASISAQMGRGDDALRQLRELVDRFIQPNTMYYEAGPVIETPLSGAMTVHDMLCQSWGGVIRIFPGVPGEWRDAVLHDFRTEGAFLVSAVRRDGATRWVRVLSAGGPPGRSPGDGEPCRVRHSIEGRVRVSGIGGPAPKWRDLGDGSVELELAPGDEAVIHRVGPRPDLTVRPVPVTRPAEPWGLPPLAPVGGVVPVDLTGDFDNDGITTEMFFADGDFDGTGRTLPMAQLPQTGRTTDDGIVFSFANGGEGTKNNVIAAGRRIAVPAGSYARLHVLGAGDLGHVTVPVLLSYEDGSTATVPIRLTAWLSGPAYGETEAVRTSQIHTRGGPLGVKAALFHQRAALDPARRLVAVTLNAPASGSARAHVFALSLESPAG